MRGILLRLFVLALPVLAGCALPRIAIHDDPLSPQEHLELGQADEARGDAEAAVREYRAAARHLPLARLFLGNALFGLGRLEEAEAAYREAIRLLPGNAEAHNNLAWLLHTRGRDLDEAVKLAERAVELDPGREAFRDTREQVRAARDRVSP
jgi:tetratricopeptide (TPR) repeat protein